MCEYIPDIDRLTINSPHRTEYNFCSILYDGRKHMTDYRLVLYQQMLQFE